MSLYSIQPSYAPQTPSKVAKTDGSDQARAVNGDGSITDTVHLSAKGRMMSRLPARVAPTAGDVRELSATLAGDLKNFFRENAIDARRGVGLEVNSQSGRFSVQGDSPHEQRIAALLGARPDIARQIEHISTLSAHVAATEQERATWEAHAAAQRTAHVGAVVSDYAARFSDVNEARQPALTPIPRTAVPAGGERSISAYAALSNTAGAAKDITMIFNGTDLQVNVNGRPWLSAQS